MLFYWARNRSYIIKKRVDKKFIINLLTGLFFVTTMLTSESTSATAYPIPANGGRLIGSHEFYQIKSGDYFHSIARFYNIGLLALMESNPGIDPLLPPLGTKLQIPLSMLLPDVPHRGIVINLPEFRLYYFAKDTNKVYVFPVGIGRIDRPTPVMHSRIMSKIKDPSWTPNARIKADYLAKYGKELASTIPAGKNNPLGKYALQLEFGHNNYLIHGTNQNFGIGMRVSAGCIRMNPDDIAWLFEQVSRNVEVRIINQPIKVSVEPNGENILEVHAPLSPSRDQTEYDLKKLNMLVKSNNRHVIDNKEVKKALLLRYGIAINVDI